MRAYKCYFTTVGFFNDGKAMKDTLTRLVPGECELVNCDGGAVYQELEPGNGRGIMFSRHPTPCKGNLPLLKASAYAHM